MDHVVYLDAKAKELSLLLNGEKSMIIRGAAGRKLPHGRVFAGDALYFVENGGDGLAKAAATVRDALHTEKLPEQESAGLILAHQEKLRLTPEQYKRWSGKRYLVLIEVGDVRALTPFSVDRSQYGNMDDWLPVGDIDEVRKPNTDPGA